MSSHDRRAAARRRAWGRGPTILRFEPLEGRQLLAGSVVGPAADVLATQFNTVHSAYWGDLFHASGTVVNQGTATTTAAIPVQIYASTAPILGTAGATTMLLGVAVVPAGLQPGASYNFDQIVGLPPSTNASVAVGQSLYVTLWVDPSGAVAEANTVDKAGRGLGLDTSVIAIAPHMPANLVGTALNVIPTRTANANVLSWGVTFNITEQIRNTGEGDAPPTRARIVLTPAGSTPGGYNDVTIGSIAVPAVAAFQTTNVVQSVTLSPSEPTALDGATQFTISVVQDGDFLTQPIYPKVADQGTALDQGPIGILPGPLPSTPANTLPDLAPASVVVAQPTLNWGETFQVGAVIQNVGLGNAGKFTVRFIATGVSGDLTHGIFLGDTTVAGLAANSATNVLAMVRLPGILPYGTQLASPAYSRIYAVVDPEDTIDQASRSNNIAASAPVLLSVVGVDGTTTVPTYAASIYSTPTSATQAAKVALSAKTAKPVLGVATPAGHKVTKKKPKKDWLASISDTVTSNIEHQLKVFPDNFNKLLQRTGVTSAPAKKTTAKATK